MANIVMRNRVTTEYRRIEKDSDEFWSLRAEIHADGKPRWEQTGEHDVSAYDARVENEQELPSDLGDEDQPSLTVGHEDPSSEFVFGGDSGGPTPGELAQDDAGGAEASPEEDDDDSDYSSMNHKALQAEADRKGIAPTGTGAAGYVTKDDLLKALEEDDPDPSS